MLIKNKNYKIQIDSLSSEGQGIGRIDNFTVFIKNAVPGDLIEALITDVKKNYAIGKLLSVLEYSEKRVKPKCPVFYKCGGCNLQNLDYNYQLEYKKDKVYNDLKRIGKIDTNVLDVIGMEQPYYYRNKAMFAVRKGLDNKIKIGFYKEGTHDVTEIKDCLIQNKEVRKIITIIESFMINNKIKPYDEITNTGLISNILIRSGRNTKDIMVCIVLNGDKLPGENLLVGKLVSKIPNLKSLLINTEKHKTIKVLYGEKFIYDTIGEIKFKISALSFFQVNTAQTYQLYKNIVKQADFNENETVIDAYCGIGSISLFIAKKVKQVIGIEISAQSIIDANDNAKLNNIDNAKFICGDVKDEILKLYENNTNIDTIIIDPPRKGCESELLDTMLKIKPKKIIYVSCDPSTLARDLKILCSESYLVKEVQPVDCFCQTHHIETIVLLELKG